MCGIIGFISKDNKSTNTGKAVINQYQEQLHRGEKGFGLIEIYKDKIVIERAVEPVKALMDTRLSEAPIQIFHHRFPTSTDNTMSQTHPFMVSHDELEYDYCIIHNGVLTNEDDLFKIHTEELGYAYKSLQTKVASTYTKSTIKKFNDSEALAIEVARHFNGDTKEIGATGATAFMGVQLDKKSGKPLTMLWGRNTGRTLEVLESEKGLLIASEINKEGAESIRDNSFEEFDLVKYFKSKAKSYDAYNAVASGDLQFYVKPAPVPTPFVGSKQTSMGFGVNKGVTKTETNTQTTTSTTTSPSEGKDDERETSDYIDNLSDREKAFEKMAKRVITEMEERLEMFFADLAYSEVDEGEVDELINYFGDLMDERIESAEQKVRPYFDHKEEKEMDYIMKNEIMPYTETVEDQEKAINETTIKSINEKANESQRKFNSIVA